MPLDLSAHVSKTSATRTIQVPLTEYEGDPVVEVSYDPTLYNAEIEASLTRGFDEQPAIVTQDVLLTFVTSWDMVWEGEPIPVSEEGLQKLHLFKIQVPIMNAMMEDMGEMGKSLRSGSPKSSSTGRTRQPKSKATARSGAKR